jgi:hypothetical protein
MPRRATITNDPRPPPIPHTENTDQHSCRKRLFLIVFTFQTSTIIPDSSDWSEYLLVTIRGSRETQRREIRCGHRPFPRRRVRFCRYRQHLRQVFGLTGYLFAPASQSTTRVTSANLEFSFLITAAGQFRIFTGFPFSLLLKANTGNTLSIDQINIPNNVIHRHKAADVNALSRSLSHFRIVYDRGASQVMSRIE